jgi:hypothetical protein
MGGLEVIMLNEEWVWVYVLILYSLLSITCKILLQLITSQEVFDDKRYNLIFTKYAMRKLLMYLIKIQQHFIREIHLFKVKCLQLRGMLFI